MSAFEDFVNLELPRRTALLTPSITSYDGDPNDVSAPAILTNCPVGTMYTQSDGTTWQKVSTGPAVWTKYLPTTGGTMTGDLTMGEGTYIRADAETSLSISGSAPSPGAGSFGDVILEAVDSDPTPVNANAWAGGTMHIRTGQGGFTDFDVTDFDAGDGGPLYIISGYGGDIYNSTVQTGAGTNAGNGGFLVFSSGFGGNGDVYGPGGYGGGFTIQSGEGGIGGGDGGDFAIHSGIGGVSNKYAYGGDGGGFTIASGGGGNSDLTDTEWEPGNGGAFSITAGAGGSITNEGILTEYPAGGGGGLTLSSGAGGDGGVNSYGGPGGNFYMYAGAGGGGGGQAGSFQINGGDGGAANAVQYGGIGGELYLYGGNGGASTATQDPGYGGGVYIRGGVAGPLDMAYAGDGADGGSVEIRGGIGNGSVGVNGYVDIGTSYTTAVTIGHTDSSHPNLVSFPSGAQISTTAVKPAAASGNRGTLWIDRGGAGVADKLYICIKDAGNNYVWKEVTLA